MNIKATKKQLDDMEAFMGKYDSKEEVLLALGAIKMNKHAGPGFEVRYIDGLAGSKCPVTGLEYPGPITYPFYDKLIDLVISRGSKRKWAERMDLKAYEEMAKQL